MDMDKILSRKPERKMKKKRNTKKITGRETEQIVFPEYYLLSFHLLHKKYLNEVKNKIRKARTEIKKKYESILATGESRSLSGDDAFLVLRGFLDELEKKISLIIRAHSPFYWIHLYRRVGPGHVSEATEKSDEFTLTAVRRTVEAAIFKYGDLSNTHDMAISDSINPRHLLDGLFFESLSLRGYSEENIFKIWGAYKNQWVMKEYQREDHERIYILEGYAYEYWRAMAYMRAIAKGAQLDISPEGKWKEVRSRSLDNLIKIYDHRLARGQKYLSTAKGLLSFDNFCNPCDRPIKNNIFFVSYNSSGVPLSKISDDFKEVGEERSNFIPASLDGMSFLKSHKILERPFFEKWGFKLENVILFFSVTSAYVLSLRVQDATNQLMGFFQFLQRAYIQVNVDTNKLASILAATARKFDDITNDEAESFSQEILSICQHFSLSNEAKNRVSLWTFGPRPLIIPYGETSIIDVGGLQLVLENLFFSIREDQQQRGYEFENILREETEKRGYDLLSNRILRISDSEYRETDLAIRVGDNLILCDCRSIERPLDLFLGKPSTQSYRTKLLQKKVKQIISLKKYITLNPAGTNYDFSWAKSIISVAVLPDTEWIWTEDKDHWVDIHREIPIILSAEELFKELNRL